MATDIAFSLGVLAMLGDRVPISLKIFLTTLAVVDDIGGILVIAIFYSTHINYWMLLASSVLLGILVLGGRFSIQSKMFYLGIGAFIWFLFLNAGIHPTIAGINDGSRTEKQRRFNKSVTENVKQTACDGTPVHNRKAEQNVG